MQKIKKLNFIGTARKNNRDLLSLLLMTALAVYPSNAFASGGVSEFAGPLEKIIGIFQGPLGLAFSIACLIICMISYGIKQSEFGETLKGLVNWVLPISGICFAGSIVTYLFQFSGAIIS